jgi:hypothetical protein
MNKRVLAIVVPQRADHQLTPQETEIIKLLFEGHSYTLFWLIWRARSRVR